MSVFWPENGRNRDPLFNDKLLGPFFMLFIPFVLSVERCPFTSIFRGGVPPLARIGVENSRSGPEIRLSLLRETGGGSCLHSAPQAVYFLQWAEAPGFARAFSS